MGAGVRAQRSAAAGDWLGGVAIALAGGIGVPVASWVAGNVVDDGVDREDGEYSLRILPAERGHGGAQHAVVLSHQVGQLGLQQHKQDHQPVASQAIGTTDCHVCKSFLLIAGTHAG